MRVCDPGHTYELAQYDLNWTAPQFLNFVKREGPGYPGNVGHHAGTILQECWRAEIDRLKYVDNQEYDQRNRRIIEHLRNAIGLLEERAADKHGWKFPENWWENIETLPTCVRCGHIYPEIHIHT